MKKAKTQSGSREFFRKLIVSLKRKPQTIAMLVLALGFLIYSLNLTAISNSTAKIQGQGMGFSGFVTMLFSLLSFVCFLNSFPHRKKPNILMLILFFLMLGCIVYCDIYYEGCIVRALTREDHPIILDSSTAYISQAQSVLRVHEIIVGIAALLTLLVPVFAILLRKIDTSLPVEENQDMEAIELTD